MNYHLDLKNTSKEISSKTGVINSVPPRGPRMGFRMSIKPEIEIICRVSANGCAQSNFSEVKVQSFHQLLKDL